MNAAISLSRANIPFTAPTSFINPTGSVNLSLLRENFPSTSHKKGQIIFHQGAFPFGVYYIHSGVCKISREGGDSKEKIIRFAKKGDFLGYAELMSDSPLGNSAEVLEDTEVCFIPRESFMAMLRSEPATSMVFMRKLCEDLSEVEAQLTITAYKPVKRRLAESLLSLEELKNESQGNGIALSRADLAHLVGTAKETVIRFLSEFRKRKLIQIKGRNITLTNPRELMRISEICD